MKNYVKEYKGYKVPEGGAHYNSEIRCFYNYDKTMISHVEADGKWEEVYFKRCADLAIELPEAPQEWMPEVGEECEVLDTCYAHPKHSEVKVKGFYNKQVWLTLPGGEDRVVLIANCKFRPLKTQQEKDREAFISAARKATNADVNDVVATDIFDDMYHAGFTTPKEGDNDK